MSIPADRQGAGVDRACAGSCARTALRDAARPFGSAHDRRWTFLLAALWGLIVPSAILPAAAQEPVSIGLIVPGGGPLAAVGAAVRAGAERAIRRANDEGGFQGRPFRLLVVTQEGLWGRGLARVVSLSFDQPVVGVIGGLDGRGGHLIQQVVTKARIPFITPWASDFTLSRGMIPWFFQMVPDDRQQAAPMVEDAVGRGESGLVVVGDTSYDSRRFTEAVRHEAAAAGMAVHVVDARTPLDQGGAASVVLTTGVESSAGVLDALRRRASPPRVYAPLRLAVPPFDPLTVSYPAPVLFPRVLTGQAREREAGDSTTAAAHEPAVALPAAFGGDAVRAFVAAVRSAGTDPWRVRDALAVQAVQGDTGEVAFDASGRRSGVVELTGQPTR